MIALALVLIGATADVGDAGAIRETAMRIMRAGDLVALTPKASRTWCDDKRPEPSEIPVAASTQVFGKPSSTAYVLLRERTCATVVFRVHLHAWRYATADDAQRNLDELAGGNHNGPFLKNAHRLWRDDATLYFATSPALRDAPRMTKLLDNAALPHGACAHN